MGRHVLTCCLSPCFCVSAVDHSVVRTWWRCRYADACPRTSTEGTHTSHVSCCLPRHLPPTCTAASLFCLSALCTLQGVECVRMSVPPASRMMQRVVPAYGAFDVLVAAPLPSHTHSHVSFFLLRVSVRVVALPTLPFYLFASVRCARVLYLCACVCGLFHVVVSSLPFSLSCAALLPSASGATVEAQADAHAQAMLSGGDALCVHA